MLPEFSIGMQFLICTLAAWRITHLFVAEDGPWNFVFLLRKGLGNSMAGKAMDCFYCLSLWISAPLALILSAHWATWALCWISISGASCLMERLTEAKNHLDQDKNSNQK
jgi:hypothetical protein